MNTDSKVISDVDRLRKQLVSSHDSTLNKARAKSMAFFDPRALQSAGRESFQACELVRSLGEVAVVHAQGAAPSNPKSPPISTSSPFSYSSCSHSTAHACSL